MAEPKVSAGDLLCAAVDDWALHCPTCPLEVCATYDVVFNRVRLAWKVWKSSRHQAVSPALALAPGDLVAHLRIVLEDLGLGLTPPAPTLPEVQRRLHVGAATGMRLLALREGIAALSSGVITPPGGR